MKPEGVVMNGSRMRLIRMTLGYSVPQFIGEVRKVCPKANRECIQSWENDSREIPDAVAEHIEGIWAKLLLKMNNILALVESRREAGVTETIDLEIFASPRGLEQMCEGMGWGNHTAQVGLMMFLLELEEFKTKTSYILPDNDEDTPTKETSQ